jgi:hypothetical protein
MCLADFGHPSVATVNAGQSTIRPSIVSTLCEAQRIYLLPDNDAAGSKMEELATLFPPEKVFIIDLKDTGAKDLCELVLKYPLPSVSTDGNKQTLTWPVQDALTSLIAAKRKPKDAIRFKGFIAIPLGGEDPPVADWLWERRLHRGKLNMIVGMPEQGKGLHLAAIAAAVATGQPFLDGRENKSPTKTI